MSDPAATMGGRTKRSQRFRNTSIECYYPMIRALLGRGFWVVLRMGDASMPPLDPAQMQRSNPGSLTMPSQVDSRRPSMLRCARDASCLCPPRRVSHDSTCLWPAGLRGQSYDLCPAFPGTRPTFSSHSSIFLIKRTEFWASRKFLALISPIGTITFCSSKPDCRSFPMRLMISLKPCWKPSRAGTRAQGMPIWRTPFALVSTNSTAGTSEASRGALAVTLR